MIGNVRRRIMDRGAGLGGQPRQPFGSLWSRAQAKIGAPSPGLFDRMRGRINTAINPPTPAPVAPPPAPPLPGLDTPNMLPPMTQRSSQPPTSFGANQQITPLTPKPQMTQTTMPSFTQQNPATMSRQYGNMGNRPFISMFRR